MAGHIKRRTRDLIKREDVQILQRGKDVIVAVQKHSKFYNPSHMLQKEMGESLEMAVKSGPVKHIDPKTITVKPLTEDEMLRLRATRILKNYFQLNTFFRRIYSKLKSNKYPMNRNLCLKIIEIYKEKEEWFNEVKQRRGDKRW